MQNLCLKNSFALYTKAYVSQSQTVPTKPHGLFRWSTQQHWSVALGYVAAGGCLEGGLAFSPAAVWVDAVLVDSGMPLTLLAS